MIGVGGGSWQIRKIISRKKNSKYFGIWIFLLILAQKWTISADPNYPRIKKLVKQKQNIARGTTDPGIASIT